MSGLYDSAGIVMRIAERQIDTLSHNVANVSTAGYKRRVSSNRFNELLSNDLESDLSIRLTTDTSQGKLISTGNSLDLAISGAGMFVLRRGDVTSYSRQGQFRLGDGGRVVDANGFALQQAGGGDLVLTNAHPTIASDGTVIESGRPIARIMLAAPTRSDAMTPIGEVHYSAAETAMHEVDGTIKQGMLESSNVTLSDEMVAMMAAMRRAETGARLMQTYDELVGRAINTLGQGGK